MPILRKDKDSFLDFINSPQWYIEHLGALYERALLHGHDPSATGRSKMPLASFMATLTSVLCYLGIYSEFLKSILSEGGILDSRFWIRGLGGLGWLIGQHRFPGIFMGCRAGQ